MKKQDTKEIEQFKKEAIEWKNKYLRALADYQNLERRTIQEKQELIKNASSQIIAQLLEALDILEKAEAHLKDQGLTIGVQGLQNVIKRAGVEKIETLGKKFNPLEMECTEIVRCDKDDEVVEETRAGFKINGKVLRVAQVKVGKKMEEPVQKEEGQISNKSNIK